MALSADWQVCRRRAQCRSLDASCIAKFIFRQILKDKNSASEMSVIGGTDHCDENYAEVQTCAVLCYACCRSAILNGVEDAVKVPTCAESATVA